MDYLEEKLNNLPRKKMSFKKKTFLKLSFYSMNFQKNRNYFFEKKLNYSLVSFFLFLTFLFGLPIYSYASPSVTRDSFLYPLKMSLEKVELALVLSEEDKIEKYQKFSERRLDEGEVISVNLKTEDDREELKFTIDESLNLKNIANNIAGKISEEKKEVIFRKNEINSGKQKEKLNNIASQVGIRESEKLIEKIAEAIDTVSSTTPSKKKEESISENSNNFLNIKNESLPQGIEKKIEKAKELEKQVDDLRVELGDNYVEDDLEKLFEKLDRRVEEVNSSINKGNTKNINALIHSTKAISNNAKSFIKEKGSSSSSDKKKKSKK